MLFLRCVLRTSIHEAVLLPRVSMEIAVYEQLSFFLHSLDHLLGVVDCRVKFLTGVDPLPVEIDLRKIASIVADNYAVDAEHGDNFE